MAIKLRRLASLVQKEIGAGFREHVYQTCFSHALREAGCVVEERVPLTVRFRGLEIPKAGEADIVVDGRVVVELKARETIHPAHTAQLLGYLQATRIPLGLLFNFHAPRVLHHGYRRVVHPRYLVWEDG